MPASVVPMLRKSRSNGAAKVVLVPEWASPWPRLASAGSAMKPARGVRSVGIPAASIRAGILRLRFNPLIADENFAQDDKSKSHWRGQG